MPLISSPPVPVVAAPRSRAKLPPVFALPILFTWFGLIMGSWAGRIPALREALQLSVVDLSLVLLCSGIGAVLSAPLLAQLRVRLKSAAPPQSRLIVAGSALMLLLILIGMAPNLPLMMMAVLLLGSSASLFDIALNTAAAREEQLQGRSLMSRLHACACGGGLAGVTLGSVMAWWHLSPAQHFSLLMLPCALLMWVGIRALRADHGRPEVVPKQFAFVLPKGGTALLGALGFLTAMTEGSIASWSGIFMSDHVGASRSVAPLSLSAFSAMMLLSRVQGDRLKRRLGARRLICGGACVGAAGLYLAVWAHGPITALAGFAIAGLGLSLVFPFVLSAAGQQGSIAIAGVATMTYAGALVGAPLVGILAQALGLQLALAMTGLLPAAIACLSLRARLIR
jgi:predicted MFS family arabinose efflux permease